MGKTGVFYGSTTGTTENIAQTIAKTLGAGLHNVADSTAGDLLQYQNLVLGTSTWGLGDLQDDWDSFLSQISKADLTGKTIALFGLGDAGSYPDTFVDGMGIIYEAIKNKGCKIIGLVDIENYAFDSSKAVCEGKFVGLPLDEDNESNLTATRLKNWLSAIEQNMM